ncbi:MAG: hypothetical protein KAT88_06925 [Spirochaetes bacterium]|nr:hypothetical protein [Spirochaetota bacterium]
MSASKLSINDMQKVALARSMVTKPQMFLLDAPLSNPAGCQNSQFI